MNQWPKKKISLAELEQQYQPKDYAQLVEWVRQWIAQGVLKPVQRSRSNGKQPPLPQTYWVIQVRPQDDQFVEELRYQLHPALQNEYYLHHLAQYEEDRSYVLALNQFWKTKRDLLQQAVSCNERSFQIWQAEKFLLEGAGQRILKHVGLTLEDLQIYQTTEPLAYYAHHKQTPQNVLVIENKDTFYSMRRHLLSGAQTILGMPVGTLIYGAGKKILRMIVDFPISAEPYMMDTRNAFYYCGDLDYEGIAIYQGLRSRAASYFALQLFTEAYQAMLCKAAEINLPTTKEGQCPVALDDFLSYFSAAEQKQITQCLEDRRYIPQEILTCINF